MGFQKWTVYCIILSLCLDFQVLRKKIIAFGILEPFKTEELLRTALIEHGMSYSLCVPVLHSQRQKQQGPSRHPRLLFTFVCRYTANVYCSLFSSLSFYCAAGSYLALFGVSRLLLFLLLLFYHTLYINIDAALNNGNANKNKNKNKQVNL